MAVAAPQRGRPSRLLSAVRSRPSLQAAPQRRPLRLRRLRDGARPACRDGLRGISDTVGHVVRRDRDAARGPRPDADRAGGRRRRLLRDVVAHAAPPARAAGRRVRAARRARRRARSRAVRARRAPGRRPDRRPEADLDPARRGDRDRRARLRRDAHQRHRGRGRRLGGDRPAPLPHPRGGSAGRAAMGRRGRHDAAVRRAGPGRLRARLAAQVDRLDPARRRGAARRGGAPARVLERRAARARAGRPHRGHRAPLARDAGRAGAARHRPRRVLDRRAGRRRRRPDRRRAQRPLAEGPARLRGLPARALHRAGRDAARHAPAGRRRGRAVR